MYFLLRSTPLDLSADRLRGLRVSLNTPVVSIEELPVEPARATIAIHDESDGRPNVTVGVCSIRSGATVLFSFQGHLRQDNALTSGLDAALSFGESMGFLFDEDELASDNTEEARLRALALWLERMSPASGASELEPRASVAAPAPPAASPLGESFEDEVLDGEVLLLEEVADPEDDFPAVGAGEPVGADSEPPVPLSKFRHSAPSPSPRPGAQEVRPEVEVKEPPPDPNRTTLGRLKLVKRRPDGGEPLSKPSAIRRLLSSF
jgi:hypothetical protein